MGEFFTYSLNNVFAFSLALVRVSGLCVVSPFYGGEQVPRQIRVLLALCITFVIYPTLAVNIQQLPTEVVEYGLLVFKNLCVGLLIGFLVTAIFFGFQLGGRFISIHMGLAMAQMLDPFSNMQSSVIGQIFGLLTITMFVIMNGHHLILKALHESFMKIPLMSVSFHADIFQQAIVTFNIVIITSLKIAAPTMAALFAVNVIFGFISRLVPQMNVFILSLPAKIAVGIFIIISVLPVIVYLLSDVINSVFRDLYVIIHSF
ncbi:MAG: flagellar biosynthetic protein FliR [Candidatus Omnitrophica bacterium]|nr:flagellar biosynthetic protein FliR [Candidatus Omnitrophota bacterium]